MPQSKLSTVGCRPVRVVDVHDDCHASVVKSFRVEVPNVAATFWAVLCLHARCRHNTKSTTSNEHTYTTRARRPNDNEQTSWNSTFSDCNCTTFATAVRMCKMPRMSRCRGLGTLWSLKACACFSQMILSSLYEPGLMGCSQQSCRPAAPSISPRALATASAHTIS